LKDLPADEKSRMPAAACARMGAEVLDRRARHDHPITSVTRCVR
jgi:hypothetical protein